MANNGGKAALLGVVVIAVLIVAIGSSQMMSTSRLKQRLGEVEGSLSDSEASVRALNSTLSALAMRTSLDARNSSAGMSLIRDALLNLSSTLNWVQKEISAISAEAPGSVEQQIEDLLNRTGEVSRQTATLEQYLQDLASRADDLNETLANVRMIEDSYRALNLTLGGVVSNLSILTEMIQSYLNRTPANIYQDVYKSIVVVRTDLGQGSGFFYGPTILLTNWHVVEGATSIEVEFYNRQRSKGSLVGGDAYSDVAVIRVASAPEVKALVLANSSQVWVGQQVVAIGNPLGLTGSLSSGYVAQVNKPLDMPPIIVPVLELDITIAPGSSGGPLFDLSGQVVGITNAGTGYGINFAVPSNMVRRAASSILTTGSYQHPYVGISVVELTPETIESYNIFNLDPFQTGLMVTEVVAGTPAEKAGLRPAVQGRAPDGSTGYEAKDIIVALDDRPTLVSEDWPAYVEEYVSPGQTMQLQVWRSGTITTIPVTATSRAPYQG